MTTEQPADEYNMRMNIEQEKMMEKTFGENVLFHGSPCKLDRLIPNQAVDTQFEEGCQYAVYATTSYDMAVCFALGCVEDSDDAQRIMLPEYGNKIHFINCHPNYGGKGYVYVLEKDRFTYAYGSQWVCYEPIVPLETIEIAVDDYLESHCVIECADTPGKDLTINVKESRNSRLIK